jgi:hypothetical protein
MTFRVALALLLVASSAAAVSDAALQRVRADAEVIDRVAEISPKDLPQDLLRKIVAEDIELLRGKRDDGTYEFATYERLEASRTSVSRSVQPRKDDALEQIEIKGSWVYRLIFSSPSRRMLVTKNRKVFIDRVELEYVPQGTTTPKRETLPVETWIEPGGVQPVDFPDVARQATARVFARADAGEGYGNIVVTLVQARIVDNADSPHADTVASLRAIQRAIDTREVPSIRAMAGRIRQSLPPPVGVTAAAPAPAARTIDVVAPSPQPAAPPVVADGSLHGELVAIEDLLTGDEAERRRGMDRLHQLVRKTRPQQ